MLPIQYSSRFASLKYGLAVAAAALLASIASPDVHAQNADPAGPVFEDGQSQIVEAFSDSEKWIRHELWVETEFDSDGDGELDRVHVSVVRQEQTRTEGLKVPVIYGSSPYYSGTSGGRQYLWDVRHELGEPSPPRANQPQIELRIRPNITNGFVDDWLPRGFAVVHSESPGTGLSEGCPTVGGINESLAPKAVIDWLNGRAKGFTSVDGNEEVSAEWSTGKVGMTGTSYNGTLPLAAATTGVDGLEAIIPVSPNTSYWHYYRSYGLVRHPFGWLGEDIDFPYDFIHTRDSDRREYCNRVVRDGEMAEGRDRITGDYNDFWAGRDYLNVVQNVKAATLMSHAFNDWNVVPEHSYRISMALKAQGVPLQMYYHQGGHGGPPPHKLMNRWFTRYLYGVENGVEDDPKAWIVREGDDRLEPTPYADYPNPDSEPVTVHLSAGGTGMGGLSLSTDPNQGEETLEDNVSFSGATLARAEWTDHRLLYTTAELQADVHLSGVTTITVRVAADRPAVNLSIWVVSLPWIEGRNARGGIVTRGWADLQNRNSLRESEPLVPGQLYEMTFDLQPDDQIIKAGQKLGLMIFSSDRDFTLWPKPGAKLTVDLDGTTLSLPVVGGQAAFARAIGEESL